MGSLGDALPQGMKEERVRAQLVPGAVIKLPMSFDGGKPKEKRLIVLRVTESTVCTVINSERHPILEKNPASKRAQIPVSAAKCKFLDHDSFIDCSRTRPLATEDVIAELVRDTSRILDPIDAEVRAEIIARLQISSTIPPAESAALRAALGGD
jgi:hypothetical protein